MGGDIRFRIIFLILLILSHPAVQTRIIVAQARRVLREIEYYSTKSFDILLATLSRWVEVDRLKAQKRLLERYVDVFTISPVTLDPVGVIKRLEHLVDTHEEYLRKAARRIVGLDNKNVINIISGIFVGVNAIRSLYKLLRHLIVSASKSGSLLIAYQIQVIMPFIRSLSMAYYDAVKAFSVSSTIGDSAGPYVARLLARDIGAEFEVSDIDEQACVARGERNGREIYIIKACGPAPNLCNFGRVVYELGSRLGDKLGGIITVDAALKLEGEETGSVQVGIGAAIGDPGHEKYRMETIATELDVPLMAIVIKQSLGEAIVPMAESIAKGSRKAKEEVLELIEEIIPEGKAVIVVGVGNTGGVAEGLSRDFELPEPKIRVELDPYLERKYEIRTRLENKDGKRIFRPFAPGDYVGKIVEIDNEERIITEISAKVPKEISDISLPLLFT